MGGGDQQPAQIFGGLLDSIGPGSGTALRNAGWWGPARADWRIHMDQPRGGGVCTTWQIRDFSSPCHRAAWGFASRG